MDCGAAGQRAVKRLVFLGKRAVWNAAKVVGLPVRSLLNRRLATFQARSVVDKALAEQWRSHYLNGTRPARRVAACSSTAIERSRNSDLRPCWGIALRCRTSAPIRGGAVFRMPLFTSCRRTSTDCPSIRRSWISRSRTAPSLTSTRRGCEHFFGEFLRILKPGGHLVVWAGNSLSRWRARAEKRWHRQDSLSRGCASCDAARRVRRG